MKQPAHTWIAIRALGLMQKDRKTKGLAKILQPWVKHSSIGCWLPDMQNFRKGHGAVKNHTFKMKEYSKPDFQRFVLKKSKLLRNLDKNIALHDFLKNKCKLDSAWWDGAYKADQPGGRHLPDCLSSIFETILDLMLLGDKKVDKLVPGKISFAGYIDPKVAVSKEQISTFFFMISHYIADCFMPCHCDGRKLASFGGKIHANWESHWDKHTVGKYFAKTNLKITTDSYKQIIKKAEAIDGKLGLKFELPITFEKSDDIWEMAIFWTRASFALSSHIFPPKLFPYDRRLIPKFRDHFKDKAALKEYDRIILQSAVYSVAAIWKKMWRKFKP